MAQVQCAYCGAPAKLVSGAAVYPDRSDLWTKFFYVCTPCDARVGCHPGTDTPLGVLANAELRAARMSAHRAFDSLWRSGLKSRTAAYKWLAAKLGLRREHCHIGGFDLVMCRRVVELCVHVAAEIEFKDTK